MPIWSVEIKELEKLYESFKGQLPDLEKEMERLIRADDENMILLYSRRSLEVIVTDLCECELKRPRKTEPLKGIIDKLNREEKVPSHIITSMDHLNSLSTFGAHPKEFDPEQVKPVLNNLDIIIKWYLKYKKAGTEIKAKPVEKVRAELKSTEDIKKSIIITKKRFAGIISAIIAIIVTVFVVFYLSKIIGDGQRNKELKKSIAVLPFRNDSPDSTNQYFIDGTMDAILDNLCKIADLTVISRTSVERFRNTTLSIREIAKQLDVNYILEGGGQKYGNDIHLTVQLIDAVNDTHIWSSPYEGVTDNIFKLQSRIAQAIAAELSVIITPEEKQLIEKVQTLNLTAYDFYLRGREENVKYMTGQVGLEALNKAEDYYRRALQYDSGYARAYTGLAIVYWFKHYWSDYFSENFMDSVMILADIALSYDNKLSDGYTARGQYYSQTGNIEQAIEEFHKAIKLNPNDWIAHMVVANLYSNIDLVRAIENYNKAISLDRGEQLPAMLRTLAWSYHQAGFIEKYEDCIKEALKLNGDSASYYESLSVSESYSSNYVKAIGYVEKAYALDTNRTYNLWLLGDNYMFLGQYEESLKYFKKYVEKQKGLSGATINSMHRIGYVYWENGYKKEAESCFDMQIEYCNNEIKLGRRTSVTLYQYYDLAGIYAFRGEKDKAYENLRIFNQRQWMPLFLATLIKDDPLFDSIRNEPEFQRIARDVEAKYKAEHDRVEKWLEEQGML